MKNIILITGGEGMVGSQALFGIKTSHKALDVTNMTSIEKAFKKHKPRVVLHLAAMTDMALCEQDPKKAYTLNVTGTKHLAMVCKKHKAQLVYVSSGAIFDGKKRSAYKETDTPYPLNVYGTTKLEGEMIAQQILPDCLIIRTGWLFGGGIAADTKFIRSFFLKMKGGETIHAVEDRFGSPTYIPDLLQNIEKLITGNKKGLFHVVNTGMVSYCDVAKEIKKLGKFKTKIIPIKSSSFKTELVKRAQNEALASSKIKLRSWKIALKEYLSVL